MDKYACANMYIYVVQGRQHRGPHRREEGLCQGAGGAAQIRQKHCHQQQVCYRGYVTIKGTLLSGRGFIFKCLYALVLQVFKIYKY